MSGGRFALFADCLLLGVFTALAAIPVVTAYPALVTACAMLRSGAPVGPWSYTKRLFGTLRAGGFLAPLAAMAVLALDAVAVAAGVPGAKPLGALLLVAAAGAAVLGLRAAASWQPRIRWSVVAGTALRDPGGSVLLLLALVTAGLIVFLVPITASLVAGPLALAAIAVESRTRR